MYKVMIVDDEKSIRSLLKKVINWDELGLKIVGEASSGVEAIHTIHEIRPDIVFVDIQMPFMDGIEFSKLAMSHYPDLKIIMLTAFSEFEYARECIRIGVCEYLLKPIVRQDVKDTLLKVIENLDKLEKTKYKTKKVKEEVYTFGNENIYKIKDYIKENYTKEHLNLTSIAQTFGFNPSYLSRLFKAETGSNLIDYLTECRMEKAIDYAKQGELMYITAKKVGIPDPNYFGKCFKKYTKETYSEFIKSCKGL